ncbi:MAG: sulfotransferase family protein [Pseudomonadaceae bacterium]
MSLKELLVDARKRYKIRREQPQLWHFEQQGFGYIQIPKVATRSIRKALHVSSGATTELNDFTAFESDNSAHVSKKHIRRQVDQGLFVFAFVRDPLARLHSAWVNKIVDGEKFGRRNILRCHGMHYGMSFADFVRRVSELKDNQVDRHIRSQAWFLADEKGLLPQFVGQLERFGDDWQRLQAQLPTLGNVDHMNKAAFNMDHLAAYDDRTLELAVERFAKDFELFGYSVPELKKGDAP